MTTKPALSLKTCIRTYPYTEAIKAGRTAVPGVQFEFVDVKPHIAAFRRMVRDLEFDIAELAPTTYIIARAFGAPFVALPVFFTRRFHHAGLVVRPDAGISQPKDLEGKKVGVRAYSVTTGVWTRGVLQNEYGVDLDSVTWVCFEDAHVAEHSDPPNVVRAPEGRKLTRMLLDGELDAAMLGNNMPDDPRLKTVIPDPHDAARAWGERLGVVPMNHMVVVREELSRERPDVVAELFRLFAESKAAASLPPGIDTRPYGVEANRRTLELIIRYAEQQRLLPRRVTVDELFDDTTRALGA